jgi:hypothetical protein
LPNVLVNVDFHEGIVYFMGQFAIETTQFTGVKVVAHDPVGLDAQKGKIACAIYLDRPSLAYDCVSDVETPRELAKIGTKAGDETGKNDFSEGLAFSQFAFDVVKLLFVVSFIQIVVSNDLCNLID